MILIKGRIIKIISNEYTVLTDNQKIICHPRGKFRQTGLVPMVGDIVVVSDENVIIEILKRKNELVRPFISNVDQAVIVMSLKQPELSLNLLDKLLVVIEYNNIKPIICFTKIDLLKNYQEFNALKKYYQKIGYQVFTNDNDDIKAVFANNVTVFTGQTGAGKSTLLNKLDETLNITTAPISKALGRGKHTTRHVELYQLYNGLVADTPGFSALSFSQMDQKAIRDCFVEFESYKDKCKYRDCLHFLEEDCYVKKMVASQVILASRYHNYLKFINEVEK